MQVYKVFFRILARQKGQILMYLIIFLGVAALISSQEQENGGKQFVGASCSIAVFDEDHTEDSRILTKYLAAGNERVDVEDAAETIQDELYNRNIVCAIRIPKGFGESLASGSQIKKIEVTSVPGTIYGQNFKSMVNHYTNTMRSYLAGGFSRREAQTRTAEICRKEALVSMEENQSGHSALYYYFAFLPYIMISICTVGIGPILIVFHKKEVRQRNFCSPYSLLKINRQLIGGMIVTGLGMCVCYCVMVAAGTRSLNLFSIKGGLHCLNMLCFMTFCLGFVTLIGQMIQRASVLTMVSNVIALGMSFLCGVFVPLDYLGDGLVRAAHFMPAYWYVTTADWIDHYAPDMPVGEYGRGLGMELLFGAAFIAAGLAYSKSKVQKQ